MSLVIFLYQQSDSYYLTKHSFKFELKYKAKLVNFSTITAVVLFPLGLEKYKVLQRLGNFCASLNCNWDVSLNNFQNAF